MAITRSFEPPGLVACLTAARVGDPRRIEVGDPLAFQSRDDPWVRTTRDFEQRQWAELMARDLAIEEGLDRWQHDRPIALTPAVVERAALVSSAAIGCATALDAIRVDRHLFMSTPGHRLVARR